MIKYGLISETDGRTLEKTLDLIIEQQDKDRITYPMVCTTEIGVFDGQTSRGINEYIKMKGRIHVHYAIDNNKDKKIYNPFEDCELIIGNSNEVYYRIPDNSQDLIFVDGCHCFAHVISDFFCYADKVKAGGYIAFHDTGRHIKSFKDFQHGDGDNPDAYISVRKALTKIGLFNAVRPIQLDISALDNCILPFEKIKEIYEQTGILYHKGNHLLPAFPGWALIFDEADETNEAGGICVFKKLY